MKTVQLLLGQFFVECKNNNDCMKPVFRFWFCGDN